MFREEWRLSGSPRPLQRIAIVDEEPAASSSCTGANWCETTTGQCDRAVEQVESAAGGAHDDWDEYDRVRADQSRLAVLVSPERVYSNPGS